MHKHRLLRLADLLERNASNPTGVKFDLTTWGYSSDRQRRLDCGTTACAVGLACINGVFARDGLTIDLAAAKIHSAIIPVYLGLRGLSAAQKFWDLSNDAFCLLFLKSSYPIKKGELHT